MIITILKHLNRLCLSSLLALLAAVFMTAPAAAQSSCPGDLNGDRVVAGDDLAVLLGAWGTTGADLNGDLYTDGASV
jgi:hypothetical protein